MGLHSRLYRCIYGYTAMEQPKKKSTFNLDGNVHLGLKLTATVQKREMVELVEEALGMYLGWNRMTRIEKCELELYRIAERNGPGQATESNLNHLGSYLGETIVLAQLLEYLHGTFLLVEVNDNHIGYRDLSTYSEAGGCFSRYRDVRLKLTIQGRLRYQQLQAREDWESSRPQVARWRQRAEEFRLERIKALEQGNSLYPLADGPKLVLHCIPLESFGTDASFEVSAASGVQPLYSSGLGAWGTRVNYEGVACVATGEPSLAYTQVYRNGATEAVRVGILRNSSHPGIIPSRSYEEAVIQYVPQCFHLMRQLGCAGPTFIAISLIGVRGLTMAGGGGGAIDRDVLTLPAAITEDLSIPPGALLKKSLDRVWNACGSLASPYFDESGNWVGQK